MNYTVNGIFQARLLEWLAFSFSRGSSQPRDLIQVSCIADRFSSNWATGKIQCCFSKVGLLYTIFFFFFLIYYLLEYSDLQHCVSFCYKANRISYTYIHSFSDSILINVITVYWIEFPVLYRRFLLSLLYMLLLLSRFSCVRLCVTLWIVVLQDPLSVELSRQEY